MAGTQQIDEFNLRSQKMKLKAKAEKNQLTLTDPQEETQNKTKEIDALEQGFATKLARKFSLKAVFATVAGVAALAATAIAAPALVPVAGAFAAAAGVMMLGTGITWRISASIDYDKKDYEQKAEWNNYYRNGELTQKLEKLALKGVIATTAFSAAAAATAVVAAPLLPLAGAVAAASAILTTGTSAVYGFRKNTNYYSTSY